METFSKPMDAKCRLCGGSVSWVLEHGLPGHLPRRIRRTRKWRSLPLVTRYCHDPLCGAFELEYMRGPLRNRRGTQGVRIERWPSNPWKMPRPGNLG